jgi:predicted RNA-binding protein with PUA-like domain
MHWLFKEEPTHYGFNDLARDRKTAWTGVRNPLAQKNLHMVRKADEILYYHTGNEKAVVGIARAAGGAYPDPEDPSGKRAAVDIVPVRKLARPVPLAEIKGRALFRDFPLLRLPRLSVLPVGEREWETILRMSEEK